MATKLKDLNITKVDFVDAGANQRANILLFKRNASKGGESMPKKNPVGKFVAAIAKAIGWSAEEAEGALSSIAKDGAKTFNEELVTVEIRQIMDEIWDMTDAYRSSLCSVMQDEAVKNKKALMLQNTDQFCTAIKGCIEQWASKQSSGVAKSIEPPEMSEEEAEIAKSRAEEFLSKKDAKKAEDADDVEPDNPDENGDPQTTPKKGETTKTKKSKGEDEDMKINKSLLTPEERMFLEAIEKKAGITEECEAGETAATETGEGIAKGADAPAPTATESAGHELQASIAGGLLGFLRGVTLDRSQPQSPGETLGKIAATAAGAQKAVQAAEEIKKVIK